jgi:hypothetical protein
MTSPVRLATSVELERAQLCLTLEIQKAKASTILTKNNLGWKAPKWDFTDLVERASPATANPIVLMAATNSKKRYPPSWDDLLRTLIVWLITEKIELGEPWNSETLRSTIKAIRHLIDIIVEDGTAADITKVSKALIENYLVELRHSKNTGKLSLTNGIINRLVDNGLAPQLSGIEVKRTDDRNHLPSDIQPSTWDEIVALGSAFQKLRSRESADGKREDFDYLRYYTCLASLLVCAPSRLSELWRTAADIILLTRPLEHLGESIPVEDAENVDFKLALVWHPVKRGRPVIKPVPAAMQGVARECVEILRAYGEEARSTARWIMENPGVLPIAEENADLQVCRETGTITSEQLRRLFGLPDDQYIGSYKQWRSKFPKTIASHRKSGGGVGRIDYYCFQTLEAEWWELFQKKWKASFGADWPNVINTQTYKLEADRALLLVYEGQINPNAKYQNKLFLETPSEKGLVNLLGSPAGRETLFQRLNIRLPDGRHPSIQTHDLRHFLNTMAQRAGIPEPVIAMWSGRRNIAQNAIYDHRTDAERLRAHGYDVADYDEAQADDLLVRQVSQAFDGTVAPPSITVLSAREASIREMNRQLMVSITQFGFCVGDLKSDPCPHAMNCLSCARLVVCKGAIKAKAHFEAKLKKLKSQRDLLRDHIEDGGKRVKNERILPHLDRQISGAEDMLLALNDPDIADGTIIARRNMQGAVEASFADRVTLFAKEQGELRNSIKSIRNG